MVGLKTPLSLRTRAGYGLAMIVDADGVCVCEGTLSDMQAVVAAVNRGAERAATVRKLRSQRDMLLAALQAVSRRMRGGAPCFCPWDRLDRAHHPECEQARAAIAAVEGGGT